MLTVWHWHKAWALTHNRKVLERQPSCLLGVTVLPTLPQQHVVE
jgi:hypothetical protein